MLNWHKRPLRTIFIAATPNSHSLVSQLCGQRYTFFRLDGKAPIPAVTRPHSSSFAQPSLFKQLAMISLTDSGVYLNTMSTPSKIELHISSRRTHLLCWLRACFVILVLGNSALRPWQNVVPLQFWESGLVQTSQNVITATQVIYSSNEVHHNENKHSASETSSSAVSSSSDASKQNESSNSITVDWLSIGSNTRPELLQTHERLYGQSRWIRKVWSATEEDDADSQCNKVLTTADTLAIAGFCQKRRNAPGLHDKARVVVSTQLPLMLQNVTKHPVGWLCAQRRFALGLAKVIQEHETKAMPLPDYLMIVDDDTYYNIPEFVKFLSTKDASENFLIPGAVFSIAKKFRFRIHHGGFGLTISRGALLNAMTPIQCDSLEQAQPAQKQAPSPSSKTEHPFCSRLRENWMGEQSVFRNGMTLIDLMKTYTAEHEPYSSYKNWTSGFCFHGDWLLTYFLVYGYKVGKLLPPYCRENCPGYEQNEDACFHDSHICHHVTAQTMEKMASSW